MTIALLLDIDGTLVELRDHHDQVAVDPGLGALLDRLQGALDGALALVSGRTIAVIDRLLSPRRYAAAGLHGLEMRSEPGGMVEIFEDAILPAAARDATEALAAVQPGIVIEDKGRTLALHYAIGFTGRAMLEQALENIVQRLAPGWTVQSGRRLLELRPSNVDKGLACERLMAQPRFAGRAPVIIGDDMTDLHAFDYARRVGGLTISVDDRIAHAADVRLNAPADARAWLVRLHRRLLDDPGLGVEALRTLNVRGPTRAR